MYSIHIILICYVLKSYYTTKVCLIHTLLLYYDTHFILYWYTMLTAFHTILLYYGMCTYGNSYSTTKVCVRRQFLLFRWEYSCTHFPCFPHFFKNFWVGFFIKPSPTYPRPLYGTPHPIRRPPLPPLWRGQSTHAPKLLPRFASAYALALQGVRLRSLPSPPHTLLPRYKKRGWNRPQN